MFVQILGAFKGRVAILEDYDMEMGRMLTSGCDIWLNNPLRPQEASGTSGMKPPLHGGLNCSILDGWWPEAFNGKNGWDIGGRQSKSQKKQDEFDANSIYRLLEKQMRDGGDSYSLRRMQRFCQPIWDIMTNPVILDYVEDLIGPNIVAWGQQYFCKLPGDGKPRAVYFLTFVRLSHR